MSPANRIFSAEFLATAGTPSVDLVETSLAQGDLVAAAAQLQSQRNEYWGMFYNYRGWQRRLLAAFDEGGILSAVEACHRVDVPEAPERAVDTGTLIEDWTAKLAQLLTLIEQGDVAAATAMNREWYNEALAAHDGMMSRVNGLLSEYYRAHGSDATLALLQEVMDVTAFDPDGSLPFKEKVEKLVYFTRVHLLPFALSEDEEKVTFMPDPCPSGARLIRAGHYEAPRHAAIVTDAGPATYGMDSLPVYCCHEPAMEISSWLHTGTPVFIVDPPAQGLGVTPCKIYVYKNKEDIPERFYQRLGLQKQGDLIARA